MLMRDKPFLNPAQAWVSSLWSWRGLSGHPAASLPWTFSQKMLQRLKRRANKAGLLDRIDARLVAANSLGITDLAASVDFTLAFAMVHELPDAAHFFREAAAASKPGGLLLLAEPKGHVKETDFNAELQAASQAGFALLDRPTIKRTHAALLKKQ